MEILRYTFFQNALWASLLIAIACGIAGTYIVSRRIVFISGGVTHASFGGLGMGFYFGVNPLLSALVFAILSAFGVEYLSHSGNYHQLREDSVIAAVWSVGMAIGVVFIFILRSSAGLHQLYGYPGRFGRRLHHGYLCRRFPHQVWRVILAPRRKMAGRNHDNLV
ncbi:MAG: metal ABC transporter permease [Prolixibacteraceae bacterium]|nr:metal ABC transporter permease [Prolixibacteraceae bacterium]